MATRKKKKNTMTYRAGGGMYGTALADASRFYAGGGYPMYNYGGYPMYQSGGLASLLTDRVANTGVYPNQQYASYMQGGYPMYAGGGGVNPMAPAFGHNPNMESFGVSPIHSAMNSAAGAGRYPYVGWPKNQDGGQATGMGVDNSAGDRQYDLSTVRATTTRDKLNQKQDLYSRLEEYNAFGNDNISQSQFSKMTKDQAKPYINQYMTNRGTILPNQSPAGAQTVERTNFTMTTNPNQSQTSQTFNEAFGKARSSGQNSFIFNGKTYNTNRGGGQDAVTAGNNRTSIPTNTSGTARKKVTSPADYHFNRVNQMNNYQAGGMMPQGDPSMMQGMPQGPGSDPSAGYMQQLAAQAGVPGDPMAGEQPGGQPGMPGDPNAQAPQQDPQQMIMALVEGIMQKDPEAMEALKQLPPEVQQQVLQMVEQAQSQGGAPQGMPPQGMPQGPPQGPPQGGAPVPGLRYGGYASFIGYDNNKKSKKRKSSKKSNSTRINRRGIIG